MTEAPLFPCPETTHSMRGQVQCSEPVGHESAHTHRDENGQWVATWLTRDEADAARFRGEFDHHYCRCAEPEPGDCLNCGGEIL